MSEELIKDIKPTSKAVKFLRKYILNKYFITVFAFLVWMIFFDQNSFFVHRELDKQINQHLKSGWTVERLTLVEKNLLRLGVFEITSFDTPQLVAVNEAIELAKDFSDQKSARFINGLLSQFVTEEQ